MFHWPTQRDQTKCWQHRLISSLFFHLMRWKVSYPSKQIKAPNQIKTIFSRYSSNFTLKRVTSWQGSSSHYCACRNNNFVRRNIVAEASHWQYCVSFDLLGNWTTISRSRDKRAYRSTNCTVEATQQWQLIILTSKMERTPKYQIDVWTRQEPVLIDITAEIGEAMRQSQQHAQLPCCIFQLVPNLQSSTRRWKFNLFWSPKLRNKKGSSEYCIPYDCQRPYTNNLPCKTTSQPVVALGKGGPLCKLNGGALFFTQHFTMIYLHIQLSTTMHFTNNKTSRPMLLQF